MIRPHLPWVVAVVCAAALTATRVLDLTHAVLLTAAALAAWYAWRALDDGAQALWQAPPDEHRHGGRHDVSDLGWAAFTRDGRVSARVTRRVRALATHRLAGHGIDLDDPAQHTAAAHLLGTDVTTGILSGHPPTARALHHWLDAIENLHPDTERTGRPRR